MELEIVPHMAINITINMAINTDTSIHITMDMDTDTLRIKNNINYLNVD